MSTNNPFQIHPASSIPKSSGPKVKDPVCGMEVQESTAPANIFHEGVVYYFCSRTCMGAFQDNPGRYMDETAQRLLQHLAYPHPTL